MHTSTPLECGLAKLPHALSSMNQVLFLDSAFLLVQQVYCYAHSEQARVTLGVLSSGFRARQTFVHRRTPS